MIGIHFVIVNGPYYGFYFILAAAVFDFFDGFAARILHVQSPVGKELDSLADLVTFGVLPSFIVFLLLEEKTESELLPYLAFTIGIQSALRLAKFNLDERQEERFIGVPTPANALFFSTLPLLAGSVSWVGPWLDNPWFLSAITLVFAYLLTAEMPLLALKFKHFGWKDNQWRFLVLIISLLSVLSLGLAGIPIAVLTYICLSLINNWMDDHGKKV
jgi:CDP-diacylglycerol--serine O-phosphatidyltransferase